LKKNRKLWTFSDIHFLCSFVTIRHSAILFSLICFLTPWKKRVHQCLSDRPAILLSNRRPGDRNIWMEWQLELNACRLNRGQALGATVNLELSDSTSKIFTVAQH
jgi:hypothetical protein